MKHIRISGSDTLLSLLRVLLSDLLQKIHIHTNDSSLNLLGSTSAASRAGIGSTLLVQTTVDGSPVELSRSLLLVPEARVLAGPEIKDLE
jgi:hypothetical protein